jgi:hypothetical protein
MTGSPMQHLKQLTKSLAMTIGLFGSIKRFQRRFLDGAGAKDFADNLALYGQFVSPGDLCFDVGANIGHKTEVLLSLGASVVAFEPQPDCVRELKARCGQRGLTAITAAVGSKSGRLPLYVSPATSFLA